MLSDDADLATRIVPVVGHLRPALVLAGLGAFFVGTLLAGQSLATDRGVGQAGALWMVVGVGVMGAGLSHRATDVVYDLDVEFEPWQRLGIGAVSLGFLLLALVVVVLG